MNTRTGSIQESSREFSSFTAFTPVTMLSTVFIVAMSVIAQHSDMSTIEPSMEPTLEPTLEPTIEPTERIYLEIVKDKNESQILSSKLTPRPTQSVTHLEKEVSITTTTNSTESYNLESNSPHEGLVEIIISVIVFIGAVCCCWCIDIYNKPKSTLQKELEMANMQIRYVLLNLWNVAVETLHCGSF